MTMWRRLAHLLPWRRRAAERDMQEELRSIAAMAEPRELGNLTLAAERARDEWGWTGIEQTGADLRYALRSLRRSPGFAVTAILSLALGIGANTAIFTVTHALLLRPLPVRAPEELVVLATGSGGSDPSYQFAYNFFVAARRQAAALGEVLASAPVRLQFDVHGAPGPAVAGQLVSTNYYDVLGVEPALGRLLQPSDEQEFVAVLSYAFWQSAFGGSVDVVGQPVRLNGVLVTIVGVSAPGFFGTHVGERADVTVPVGLQPVVMTDVGQSWISESNNEFFLELMVRRRPGVTPERIQSALGPLFEQQMEALKAASGAKGKLFGDLRLSVEPGSRGLSELRRQFSRPLSILMAVVGLVLLVACANVANLLLARSAGRNSEFALRLSLGAQPGRLVRQMLTEAIVLAGIGAAIGLALAWAGARALGGLITDRSDLLSLGPDLAVLSFTSAIAIATGLVFGLVPALRTLRVHADDSLKSGTRAIYSPSRLRLGRLLVVGQLAGSLALLVGAGVFVRTLLNLQTLDLGFNRTHLVSVRLEPRGSNQKRSNLDGFDRLYRDVLERVRAIPGVRAASLCGTTPLAPENYLQGDLTGDTYAPQAGDDLQARMMQIYPGYFATMGVPLLAGRDFTDDDNAPNRPVRTIVNELFARRYFGSARAAIGRRVVGRGPNGEIIGVVGDVRDRAMREAIRPMVYSTYRYTTTGRGQMTLVVRATGDLSSIIGAVQIEAQRVDPAVPVNTAQPVSAYVDAALSQERLIAWLGSVFGLLALVLGAVGTYGFMAYSVSQRAREFGVRLALGAAPGRLRRQVLGEGSLLLAGGILVGLAIAAGGTRALRQLFFGIGAFDVTSFAGAAAVLALTALVALFVPAWRASRVDPLDTLRAE
jgi:predicted permease